MGNSDQTTLVNAQVTQALALCLDCNYSLRGLTEHRCPECGRVFDPQRPETMNLSGRAMGGLARWLVRPVGWPTHLLVLWAIAYPAWEWRRPGGIFDAQLSGVLLWLLVTLIWLGRLAVRHIVAGIYDRPKSELTRAWGHWLVAPILLTLWILVPNDLPQRIAFAYSRPALDRFVAQVMANPAAMTGVHRVGLYWVSVDGIIDGGVLLFTGCGYNASRCGFAYFPDGPSKMMSDQREYWLIEGRWYEYWANGRGAGVPTSLPSTFPTSR
ncbi:MAG TPA: hypothetical protein VHP11_16490 [Tepidisphaeraceae bacterium]|nr:hypothetical protein [Tepidisphaeraceae bacterium]